MWQRENQTCDFARLWQCEKSHERGLTSIAAQGWQPLASAMVGTGKDPPIWACNDWRPILGTSRVLPEPLTYREEQLLLSQWARTPLKKLPITHAAHTWLNNKQDLPRDCSPDCPASPHSPKPVSKLADKELIRYCAPLFQPIEPGQDEEILLKLRFMVDTMSLDTLRQLNSLLLGGHFTHLNRKQWLKVVQDSLNQTSIAITTQVHLQLLQSMITLTHLSHQRFTLYPYKLLVTLASGQVLPDHEVVLYALGCNPLPADCLAGMYVQVVPERDTNTPVTPASTLAIDCTGLGGHDLGGPPFDICLRADKHGQSIYGPSVARITAI